MAGLEDIIFQLAELRRIVGQTHRAGTVSEVKGDMIRVLMGKGMDGSDVLSPWLHTNNHRGGSTERRFYKKGQNVMVHMPNGDPRQAMVLPYAPNDTFKAPDIADDSKPEEETYQLGDLRVRKSATGYDIMMDKEGATKIRLNKDGGFTGKVGNFRVASHSQGTKLKYIDGDNKHYIVITKDGIFCSGPITVGPDLVPDDNN